MVEQSDDPEVINPPTDTNRPPKTAGRRKPARRVPQSVRFPPLSVDQVLEWADLYVEQHGAWPTIRSGAIPGAGTSWNGISSALKIGYRGLPQGLSLARLLAEHRGVRNRKG